MNPTKETTPMSADPTTDPAPITVEPMRLRVALERKPDSLWGERHTITDEVTLGAAEWNDLLEHPLKSRPWLAGLGTVLVHGPNDGLVLIRTEGGDYARYGARIA